MGLINTATIADVALLAMIEGLQMLQKRNRTDSPEWEAASSALAPLFEEAARRKLP